MPRTKNKKEKLTHGGKREGSGGFPGNQNAAKKPEEKKQTKSVSPRLELPVYEALEARAEKNGNSATKEAEEIIKAALT